MKVNVTANTLLAVIAACLVLITVRLYNIGFATGAYAQGFQYTQGVTMMNAVPSLTPVALYAKNADGKWYPCQTSSNNTLIVEIQR